MHLWLSRATREGPQFGRNSENVAKWLGYWQPGTPRAPVFTAQFALARVST